MATNNKTFNTRTQQKHDVEANWLKATNFIPLAGEVIVYDKDSNYPYARIKIGDGNTNVNNLPFTYELVSVDYDGLVPKLPNLTTQFLRGDGTWAVPTLPVATSTELGGVKSGTDITIDASGNVSVNDDSHNHIISNVDGLQSSLDAKVPTSRTVNGKALSSDITLSASDVSAYSKTEIDAMEFITIADIDTICGTSIQVVDLNDEGVIF